MPQFTTQQLLSLFDRYDKDGDGSITREELQSTLTELGMPPTERQLDDVLSALDDDQNGTIERSEFLDGIQIFLGLER
ncbi:MAG: EF-hand domain-containing protein [Myxococcota bacterium]